MRLLGITMAYNEEDCIGNAIGQLLSSDHCVHVFDHGSTDGTADVCYSFVRSGNQIRYHYLDRKEIPSSINGHKVNDLWEFIGNFVLGQVGQYDWVTWIAADEVVRQPDGELLSHESIETAAESFDVIRPLARDFWMTTADDQSEPDYIRRIRHFRLNKIGHAPRSWRIELTPRPMIHGLHIQDPGIKPKVHGFYGLWPEGTRVSNNEWLLDHYGLRTMTQARRKVMKERNWISVRGTRPYAGLRKNNCRNAVLDHRRKDLMLETRTLPHPLAPARQYVAVDQEQS